ncbi:MAG: PAS domain S-box protein [Candidatus Bathyarchaeota archaeon]|nr:PAS domain S-box protein [Candidatus Bathyarchaeota archaeon]
MKSINSTRVARKQVSSSKAPNEKKGNTHFSEEFGFSSRQFHLLAKGSPVGIALYKIVFDEKGEPIDFVTLEVNSQFEQTLHVKRESILFKKVSEVNPKITECPINWTKFFGKVASSGASATKEAYLPLNSRHYQVYAYSPKPGYCIAVYLDITDQKEAQIQQLKLQKETQSALEANAKRYRNIIKHVPAGICEIEPGPKFRNVNDAICKMFGYSEQELLAINPLDLLSAESKKNYQEKIYENLKERGFADSLELRLKVKGGREIWCIVNAKVTHFEGKINGAFVVVYDVTARKKAEAELLFAEKRYRQLYDTTRDGIMARNLDGKMIHCNQAYANMLGYTKKELKKLPVTQLITPKWYKPRQRVINKVLQTGRSIISEREYRRKDGSIFYASVRTWPITDSRGSVVGVWSIVRDISEQKQLQKNLQQHAEILEKLVEERTKQLKDSERLVAIGQTAGMVGHDLRNPLQTITCELYLAQNDLDALPDGETKKNLQETMRVIEEQTVYMDKIISDLQAFVQPVRIEKKPVNLQELICAVLSTVTIPANIQIQTQISRQFSHVNADLELLKRVLINLITNAVQAMPKGGIVTVAAEVNAKNQISVAVKDTGVGISDDIKKQIFTPLFTTKPRGQGFGLAVCKRVMEAHGGTITFKSKLGEGAEFILTFPND